MPQQSYYGDKLSQHMTETPEGILICHDVPIGRTGWMEYLGEETPFPELAGQTVKVYRSPEELFSEETIASFEGKSVTNRHPAQLLDISTIPSIECGHVQNVRRAGDFLVADLFIKDNGLKTEVLDKMKREVSSGYMAEWIPVGEKKLEQRGIIGNHVAIVQNGRAGPRVAIKDEKPQTGGIELNAIQKFLVALGVKEENAPAAAAALDAMTTKPADDKKPDEKKGGAADEAPAWAQSLIADVAALKATAAAKPAVDAASKALDELEEKLAEDEEPDDDDKKKKADDEDPDKEKEDDKEKKAEAKDSKGKAADSGAALKKLVQDMKPIILGIPDEKARNEAVKKFVAAVQDARQVGGTAYADILKTSHGHKKKAAADAETKAQTVESRAVAATSAWNTRGKEMQGVK